MQTPTHLESGLTFGMLGRTGFQTLLKEFPTSLQFGTTLVHGERGSRGTGGVMEERGHRRGDGGEGERGHRRSDGGGGH